MHKKTIDYHKETLETKGRLDGGQKISSEHECDDGNRFNRDGCNDQCKVEPGFICRMIPIGNNREGSECLEKTKIEFFESITSIVPLTYSLKMSRRTMITKEKMAINYKLILTTDEIVTEGSLSGTSSEEPEPSPSSSTEPESSGPNYKKYNLSYEIETQNGFLYEVSINGNQFDKSVQGKMKWVKKTNQRLLQNDDEIVDSEQLPVDFDNV